MFGFPALSGLVLHGLRKVSQSESLEPPTFGVVQRLQFPNHFRDRTIT